MINNLELLQPLLVNEDDDLMFYGQVIRRRKDWGNGGLEKGAYVVNTFTFKDYDELKSKFGYLKNLANSTGSRIYLNVNRRSKQRLTHNLLVKLSHRIASQSLDSLQGDFAQQLAHSVKESRNSLKWMIDIDSDSDNSLKGLQQFLQEVGSTTYVSLPTVHGRHLLVSPFPITKMPTVSDYECKKDSFVLLYYKFGG